MDELGQLQRVEYEVRHIITVIRSMVNRIVILQNQPYVKLDKRKIIDINKAKVKDDRLDRYRMGELPSSLSSL